MNLKFQRLKNLSGFDDIGPGFSPGPEETLQFMSR
jgi:hypothetical protein